MKLLLTIPALLLALPVVALIGIALGPAILVMVFMGGFALIMTGLVWLVDNARSHYTRRARVTRLHP